MRSRTLGAASGSSPRGRGKLLDGVNDHAGPGLIPAWAGKTMLSWDPRRVCWAHPRVGGENRYLHVLDNQEYGSSPRGRGKHSLTCAFIKRVGQILESLELCASSGNYSLMDAYATDAPQDQARNTGLAPPSSRAAS